MRLVLRYIDLGITFTIVTWLLSAVPLQPHAAERLRPAEITLFPPLIDGDALLDYSHSSTIIV